jgi:glycyl-tRNA synthetase beta chain
METLLVEILTEELPPKALARLSRAFADALAADLSRDDFLEPDSAVHRFATPRRLAVQITKVREVAPDRPVELAGPSVKAGLDAQGNPTPALQGFARKNGVAVEALEQRDTPKGRVFYYKALAKGGALAATLGVKVATALKSLPIPKVMRWGASDAEFVRPVHGLIMLHGSKVVAGKVLDVESHNRTLGHRFLSAGPIAVPTADDYERVLRDEGSVVAGFEARKEQIGKSLERSAGKDATLVADEALLDEVTALVEFPAVYAGSFSADFLEVPQECLILSMKQHQKYFPLFAREGGRLLPRFLLVSNLRTDDPVNIVRGNERVLRARLSDAKFFYDQDRKVRLEDRVAQLANVVYHNRLGTQLERVERLQTLAGKYCRALKADAALAERGAWLAKADLITGMVGEFPELQGIMGRYYALHDGEPAAVAEAIEAHYHPRHAGDTLPESPTAAAVALADKLEALAGFFGIGQQPTGDKDPYALRRHALGVIRILSERALPLRLTELVTAAFAAFDPRLGVKPAETELIGFFFDRMRGYFIEAGYSPTEVDAVLALRPDRIDLIRPQLEAVRMFNTLPEAPSLAAANKRIGNILKKVEGVMPRFDPALLVEAAEKALAAAFSVAKTKADAHYEKQDYAGMLRTLAALRAPVDAFFDAVMVMSEDTRLRDNRIALLAQLRETMNRIADISRLAA